MLDRYSLSPMKELWSDEYKFQKMLEVELSVCKAWNKKGLISDSDLQNILKRSKIDVDDIRIKEETCRHETVAFIESVSEKIGKSSKYFHFGLTSSDILDTALSLTMKESMLLVLKKVSILRRIIFNQAKKYKDLVMIGRTHGVHAEPITLGFKLLLYTYELDRDINRLKNSLENISYGKISGSMGTYAQVDPFIEKYVCKDLGLKQSRISSQILQRDRHAEYIFSLSILGSTLEKIATEIRNLHRTEIQEVTEPFEEGQKGSSSMPHKKNPILCERICGLSRLLRGNLLTSMENITLWHERDMSHSSNERIIVPDSLCIVDFMLTDMIYIVKNITVHRDNIQKTLKVSEGKIFSQTLMLKLVNKGAEKSKSYDVIQKLSFESGKDFLNTLKGNKFVKRYLTEKEIDDICTYKYYTKNIDKIFRRF
ncbi:MAG: adenylosuccinate lyase [Candidatus Dojkabacteria bacterium]|nr:adenylosuccinate lyase [Candidatus Dojkabacteria bacterium]